MRLVAALLALAFASVLSGASHALTFPPLTGRVVDQANILDAATRQALTAELAAVEAKSGLVAQPVGASKSSKNGPQWVRVLSIAE